MRRVYFALQLAVLGVLYYLSGRLGLDLQSIGGFSTLLWAPTGLSIAALLLIGMRLWPAISLAAFAVNLSVGAPVPAALGIAAGNTLEAVLAVWMLRRFSRFNPALDSLHDVLVLVVFAGLLSTAVAATMGVLSLWLSGMFAPGEAIQTWITWWLGDMLSALVVAPFLLVWVRGARPAFPFKKRFEAWAMSLLFCGGTLFVYFLELPATMRLFPMQLITLPFLVWAVMRFGTHGAVTGSFLVSVMALFAALRGAGPFVLEKSPYALWYIETYRIIAAVTVLVFAAVVAERERQRLRAQNTEHRLRESNLFHQSILDTALDAIISMDHEGKVLEFNPAAERIFGIECSRALGKELASLIVPPRLREAHRRGLAGYLATGQGALLGRRTEMPALRADGSEFPVELSIVVQRAPGPPRFTGHLRDITHAKQAEHERNRLVAQLEEAVRVRDEFIAVASHELKTPITSLKLQSQLLARSLEQSGGAGHEKLQRHVSLSLRQIDSLAALIDNILDVSRLSAGAAALHLEDVDLTAIIQSVIERQSEEIRRSGSRVEFDSDGPLVGCWDRVRLEKVVTNLLNNALKYGSGKPIALRSVHRGDDLAEFSIRDRGIGIAKDDQSRIFKRFERTVPVRQYGGFGLGLYIVKLDLEAHGGQIRVDSAPGEGATFTVELPVHCPAGGDI